MVQQTHGLIIFSLMLTISTVSLVRIYGINDAQNNLPEKSAVIQNENDGNQFVHSTSKEESPAENNITKNEDDILPAQNTRETKNDPSIIPSDDRHPGNKQLLPETSYTASDLEGGEPGTITKNTFKGTQQSTYKTGVTANTAKQPGAKTGKVKSAEQHIRVSTATLWKNRYLPVL